MKKPQLFTIALFLSLAFACSNKNKTQLDAFAIFEGSWQLKDSNTFEIWQNHDTFLSGQVINIENEDTLLVENLKIFRDKNETYYQATVPSQNEGKPVRFKLTAHSSNSFQFENPEHDFPQKIVYTFLNKKELLAIISGGIKQISFNYQKTK